MTIIVILALLGLAGVIIGVWALVAAFLTARQSQRLPYWRLRCSAMLALGILLGWAAWHFPLVLGYHRTFEDGRWWFAGLPFFEACFDSRGRDFIGEFTLPAVIGNAVFWFLVPQIALFLSRLYPFSGGVGEQFAEVSKEAGRYFLTLGVLTRQH